MFNMVMDPDRDVTWSYEQFRQRMQSKQLCIDLHQCDTHLQTEILHKSEGNLQYYAVRKLGSVVGSVEWHFITMIAKVLGRGRIVAFNGTIQAISACVLRTGNLPILLQRSGSHGVK